MELLHYAIRPEVPADIPQIDTVTREAFKDHPFSRQTEHLIVRDLRAAGDLRLSLVAVEGETLLGHVAFSDMTINGGDCGWVCLGPISVDPPVQRSGIGSALVRRGLDEMRRQGVRGCFLVGDPAFYGRLGFQPRGLRHPHAPAEVCLSLSFSDELPIGEVQCHPAFEVEPER